jgi:hypothetical protein
MTRHENRRSRKRYSLIPSQINQLFPQTFQLPSTNVPFSSLITSNHNTTIPAADDALARSRQESTCKNLIQFSVQFPSGFNIKIIF